MSKKNNTELYKIFFILKHFKMVNLIIYLILKTVTCRHLVSKFFRKYEKKWKKKT